MKGKTGNYMKNSKYWTLDQNGNKTFTNSKGVTAEITLSKDRINQIFMEVITEWNVKIANEKKMNKVLELLKKSS